MEPVTVDIPLNAAVTFEQAWYLLGGGVLAMLGAVFVLQALHVYLRALRVPAVICGLRRNGRVLHPVYKFSMPRGGTYEIPSDTGSSLLRHKETGRAVTLYVFENDPYTVRSDLRGTIFVGLAFFLPGGMFLAHGALAYPFSTLTGAMLSVFLLLIAQRLYKIFAPADKNAQTGKNNNEWRDALNKKRRERFAKMQSTTMEAFLKTPEGQQMAYDAEQTQRMTPPGLAVLGMMALGAAWYTGSDLRDMVTYGQRGPGVIEKFEQENVDGKTLYRAHVTFIDMRSENHSFADKTADRHPRGQAGDKVSVLYTPDAPAQSARIDRGLASYAGWSLFWLLCGLAAWLGGFIIHRDARANRKEKPAAENVE